jgi:hypothetical protein
LAPHIREGDGDRGARPRRDGAARDQEFGGDVRHRTAVREARRDQAAYAAAQRGAFEAMVPASGLQRFGEVFVGADPQHGGAAGAGRRGPARQERRLEQREVRFGVRPHFEARAGQAPRARGDGC